MGRMIAKFGDRYCEWSSIVDAPITFLMTREELDAYIQEQYGLEGMRDLPKRMERVALTGTSAYDGTTTEDLLRHNRAGEQERAILTEAAMIDEYTFKEKV